jgi:hypothetical protein
MLPLLGATAAGSADVVAYKDAGDDARADCPV